MHLKKALLMLVLVFGIRMMSNAQNCSINAGIDLTKCANELVTLQAFVAGPINSTPNFSWTQVSGSTVTIVNASSQSTIVRGFSRSGGTYRFVAGIDCQLGGRATDTVTITILATPNKPFAGKDTTFCPGVKQLNATQPASGEIGSWSEYGVFSHYTGVYNSSLYNTNVNSYSKGSYSYYRWELKNTGTGCTDADTVFITYCGGETVNAGPDILADSCYLGPSTSVLLGTNTFNYNNSVPSNPGYFCGQYASWTVVSKPSSAPVPTISNGYTNMGTTASNLFPGVYKFAYSVFGTCASGSDTLVVTVPNPLGRNPTITSNKSITLCGQTTAALTSVGSLQSKQRFVNWTKLQGPSGDSIGSVSSLSTNSYYLKLPTSNQLSTSFPYPYIYKFGVYDSVCKREQSALVYIYPQLNPTVNFTSNTLNLACNAATGIAYFKYKNVGWGWVIDKISGPTSFSYSTTLMDTVNGRINFSGLTAGTYVFRIRSNQGGCASNIADQITVYVSQSPTQSNAGSNQKLNCNVDSTNLIGNIPTIGTGKWFQISGPTTVVFNPNANANYVKLKNLAAGTYTLRWLVDGGTCPSTYDDVQVFVVKGLPVKSEAGPNKTICYGTPIKLQGSAPTSAETGIWTVSPTGPVFSNNADSAATVTGLAASTVYTFRWTVSNACGSKYDTVQITTNSSIGPIAANAGADACYSASTTSITLSGNAPSPSGVNGTWSAVGTFTGSITSVNSNTTTVTSLTPGHYKFVWTLSISGCSSTTDTVEISIANTASTAKAGKDSSICAASLKLYANKPAVGTGIWSQTGGPSTAIFTNVLDSNATVSSLIAGTYTFRWTVKNGVCPSNFDDVVIQVSANPSAAKAMNDTLFCGSGNLTYRMLNLKATRPAVGQGRWYFQNGPSVYTISPDTSIAPSAIQLSQSGKFVFIWSVTISGNCPAKKDSVVVLNVLTPNAGADQSFCNQNTVVLTGNYYSNGTWRQIGSSPSTATLTALNGWSASATGLISGQYTFEFELTEGSCTKRDTVKITNYGVVSNFNIGNDTSICLRDTNEFVLNGPTVPSGAKALWTVFSYPYGYTPTFSGRTDTTNAALMKNANYNGNYFVKYRISNGTCFAEDFKVITIVNGFSVPAISDQSRCGGSDTFTLSSSARVNTTAKWSRFSGSGSNPTQPDSFSTKVVVTKSNYQGNYLLKLKDVPSRCIYKDTVTISHSEAPIGYVSPATTDTVCGKNEMNYKYFYTTNNVPGTLFTWTRDNQTNVTGIPNSGSGTAIGGYTTVNNSSVAQKVVFTIQCQSPSPTNCMGNVFYDTLIVKPNINYTFKLKVDTIIKCFKEPVIASWTKIPTAKNYCLSTKPNCGGDILYTGLDTSFIFNADYPYADLFCYLQDSQGCNFNSNAYIKIQDPSITPKIDSKNNKFCYYDSTYIFDAGNVATNYIYSSKIWGQGTVYYNGKNPGFDWHPDSANSSNWIYMLADIGKGCPGLDSIEIIVLPRAKHWLELDRDTVCYGDNFNFTLHFEDPTTYYNNAITAIEDGYFGGGNLFYYGSDTTMPIYSTDLINVGHPYGKKFQLQSYVYDLIYGCYDTASTWVTVGELPTVNAGADIGVLNIYDSAKLGGTPAGYCSSCFGNLKYKWTPNDSLTSDTIPNPYTKTDSVTTYRLTVTDSIFGCTSYDEVQIVSVLPVTWLSFNAKWRRENQASLVWQIADGSEVKEFIVERSFDGNQFNRIGSVAANTVPIINQQYKFLDLIIGNTDTKIVYYRILCIENNGHAEYSEIKALYQQNSAEIKMELVPNPNTGNCNISINCTKGNGELKVYDNLGRIILKDAIKFDKGINLISLNLKNKISAGIYTVEVVLPNGVVRSSKMEVME